MKAHNRLRLLLFAIVAALHGIVILTVAFAPGIVSQARSEGARVMKLADFSMEEPPKADEVPLTENRTVDETAETMIETEEVPVSVQGGYAEGPVTNTEESYLRMHQVSVRPVFDEQLITGRLVYPPIALRSGIEGRVRLELFIDKTGLVRNIVIVLEDPPDKGFGEAAVRAFTGLRCVPAQANGENVSIRCAYPISFKIK